MKQLTIVSKITDRTDNQLNNYFREIAKYPKFTPEEEAICAEKAAKGDKDALEDLIKRNLRFVVSVAKQYNDYGVPLSDLINEGNFGLIKAANRFQPNMGFKFISYAVWWIRKHITEHLTNYSRTVRIPANKINSLARLNKKINILEQKLGKTPDIEEIKLEYGDALNENEIKSFECLDIMNIESLDRSLSDDNDAISLSDIICDNAHYTATDKLVNDSDVVNQVKRMLNTLKPNEKAILISLYGLDGKQPMTLNEVGLIHKVTRESIRLTKEKALSKLRKNGRSLSYLFSNTI
jgi:RNA polymerase primary sigma factor